MDRISYDADSRQPSACVEPLMLWAVRRSNPTKFVHVGLLEPSEKGASCACLCKGCGESVVAVNVDKGARAFPAPRRAAQRKHFRHRSVGAAEARCRRKVAQLLALQLFVEQNVIDLPQRERLAHRKLPSGAALLADLSSAGERVEVMHRVWIDDAFPSELVPWAMRKIPKRFRHAAAVGAQTGGRLGARTPVP